jgi:N-acetylmuramoyl-L-alanine amidase
MRWTKRQNPLAAPTRQPVAPVTCSHASRVLSACALALTAFSALLLFGSAPEKHLAVYSVAANYSLPLVQHDGRDYVGLLELLEPMGQVSAKLEGSHWRIQYNHVEATFQTGKSRARVQGREADLGGKFLMENQRGLVPVASLGSLLPRILGGPVTLHADSGRLFIGNVATHFTASLAGENPPRLVFRFSAAVNPTIATETGALRMTFTREPLVAPASSTLTFGSKAIPSAIYSEANGAAVITVASTVPVMASFSSDHSTITVSPTPAPQPSAASAPAASPSASRTTTTPATLPQTVPPARRYFAVVDASHGGDDHGETLTPTLLEKDVTVALAHSLRQELESRGITTLVLRDSDANLSADQRAVVANADHAAIYIALHAASAGPGVRVYTALLPHSEDDRGPFHSWTTAQRAALNLSQSTAAAVSGELQKRQIAVRVLSAPLRPLNNITGAAIAIEVAPPGSDISQLSAPDYQQLVTSAIATAIAAAREQLAAQ